MFIWYVQCITNSFLHNLVFSTNVHCLLLLILQLNPSRNLEYADRYLPKYAGKQGVVVCGSENEVEPDQDEEDYYAVRNRKLDSHRIDYSSQIRTVWLEQALHAKDQACQKLAWHLSKIFAYAK